MKMRDFSSGNDSVKPSSINRFVGNYSEPPNKKWIGSPMKISKTISSAVSPIAIPKQMNIRATGATLRHQYQFATNTTTGNRKHKR